MILMFLLLFIGILLPNKSLLNTFLTYLLDFLLLCLSSPYMKLIKRLWLILVRDLLWKKKWMLLQVKVLGNWNPYILTKKWLNINGYFSSNINIDGTIKILKGRLVAKHFKKTYGIDYFKTFSSVSRLKSVRVITLLLEQPPSLFLKGRFILCVR